MRRKPDIAQLRKILTVRKLQRGVAEAAAARAATALLEKSGEQEKAQTSRDAAQQHWQDLHTQGAMPLELVRLWGSQVQEEEIIVEKAGAAVDVATSARDECAQEFHAMEQRSDMAGDMVRMAVREHLRGQEEAALQDAADRHLQKRSVT